MRTDNDEWIHPHWIESLTFLSVTIKEACQTQLDTLWRSHLVWNIYVLRFCYNVQYRDLIAWGNFEHICCSILAITNKRTFFDVAVSANYFDIEIVHQEPFHSTPICISFARYHLECAILTIWSTISPSHSMNRDVEGGPFILRSEKYWTSPKKEAGNY